MIYQDKKEEIENQTNALDYLASFWNPEAVKKIKASRDGTKSHAFKDDKEFEKDIISGNYKKNELLDAVIKLNELEKTRSNNIQVKRDTKSKLPTDLASIHRASGKIK